MDFLEADRRYEELKRRYGLREIGTGELDARLKQLMVQDGEGRLWTKSRETGEWHCKEGDAAWARGTPPVYRQGNHGGQPSYAPKPRRMSASSGRRLYLWIVGCGGVVALLVLGLALVIYPLVSSLVEHKRETERAIGKFHSRLNSERYAEIHAEADEEFREGESKEGLSEYLGVVHKKLGAARSSQTTAWQEESSSDIGTTVSIQRRTRFEEGEAVEEFVWRMSEGEPRLLSYNIDSPVLVTGGTKGKIPIYYPAKREA